MQAITIERYQARRRRNTIKALSMAAILVAFSLSVLAVLIVNVSLWPETGCLIYGIDFNGKNEPFGLFC